MHSPRKTTKDKNWKTSIRQLSIFAKRSMALWQEKWSERQDSNLRHPAPKAGALAKLSYAPTEDQTLFIKSIGSATHFALPESTLLDDPHKTAAQPHHFRKHFSLKENKTSLHRFAVPNEIASKPWITKDSKKVKIPPTHPNAADCHNSNASSFPRKNKAVATASPIQHAHPQTTRSPSQNDGRKSHPKQKQNHK